MFGVWLTGNWEGAMPGGGEGGRGGREMYPSFLEGRFVNVRRLDRGAFGVCAAAG